jgi:predicted enzyme related to lactoylglutathione lyase
MAGELSFFELGVEDAERGRVFYGELFGWKFEPGPSGNGFMITAPNVSGGIHSADAGATPYVFFAVDDLDAALARVRELGGAVDDMEVGGDFKICRDDQGSPFGLHQPSTPKP